jgi:hypothetical protein
MGPVDKNSINDQKATEMGMQFNVSYNNWVVKKISTIEKIIAFISLGNNQDYSLQSSEVLSTFSVKISFFSGWRHFVSWTDVRPSPGQ